MKWLLIILVFILRPSIGLGQLTCLGTYEPLFLGSHMPYVTVQCGNTEGRFLIDFATDTSTIDPKGFTGGIPQRVNGIINTFRIKFEGNEYQQVFSLQDHKNIFAEGIRQAGIVGTDILSQHIYTIDFLNKRIYIVNLRSSFCSDQEFYSNGFLAASTVGYFSNDNSKLKDPKTNVPTIPIKINGVQSIAQLDPGFDDRYYNHSININRPLYNLLRKRGINITEVDSTKFTNLSSCKKGYNDTTVLCRLSSTASFEITGTKGEPIIISHEFNIFLKATPPEAKACGGIGTWDYPGAQIGASFLLEFNEIVFDPFKSMVWFKSREQQPLLSH